MDFRSPSCAIDKRCPSCNSSKLGVGCADRRSSRRKDGARQTHARKARRIGSRFHTVTGCHLQSVHSKEEACEGRGFQRYAGSGQQPPSNPIPKVLDSAEAKSSVCTNAMLDLQAEPVVWPRRRWRRPIASGDCRVRLAKRLKARQ